MAARTRKPAPAKRPPPPPKPPPPKRPESDKVRLNRLLRDQAQLLDDPIDDTMAQRQKLADIRSRIYSVKARMAKRPSEQVAFERIANESGTEARQAAKAAHIDRVMELLRARDQELEVSAALTSLSGRRQ